MFRKSTANVKTPGTLIMRIKSVVAVPEDLAEIGHGDVDVGGDVTVFMRVATFHSGSSGGSGFMAIELLRFCWRMLDEQGGTAEPNAWAVGHLESCGLAEREQALELCRTDVANWFYDQEPILTS